MAAHCKISSVFRQNLFNGKVAIVTGGGTGIGKAITQELLFLGCKVMIASRKLERLSESAKVLQSQITNKNAQLEHMQCNIRQEDQVKDLISTTVSRFGRLDFLVNNGGGQFPSPAADIKTKGWNAVIETNLTGTFLCCREVTLDMRVLNLRSEDRSSRRYIFRAIASYKDPTILDLDEYAEDTTAGFYLTEWSARLAAHNQWMAEHGGVIVNIIADMWKGFPMMSHTGAARAAVDNLTKSLAIEWASDGVRINSVAPGSSIYSETAAANYGSPEIFNRNIPGIPAKRLGTVEEVSACVCFLLSPAASFISGETVKVDAGASLYSTMWQIPDHNRIPAYKWETDIVDSNNDSGNGSKSKL